MAFAVGMVAVKRVAVVLTVSHYQESFDHGVQPFEDFDLDEASGSDRYDIRGRRAVAAQVGG